MTEENILKVKNALRTAIIGLTALAAPLVSGPAVLAQSYPDKPITLIVPYGPGGSLDTAARLMGEKLVETIGQPVIIENIGGAAGAVGTRKLGEADADGYTIGMGNPSTHTTSYALGKDLPYNPMEDFVPISVFATNYTAIAARPGLGITTMTELVSYAKDHPGELTYGSSGVGTSQHMLGELLNDVEGIDLLHVPYQGGAAALTALLGDHVDLVFGTLSSFLPQAESGKLNILAVLDSTTYAGPPQIPSAEANLPNYKTRSSWIGIFGPAGMDPDVVATISSAIEDATHDPEVAKALAERGLVVRDSSPEEAQSFVDTDLQFWTDLAKSSGLSLSQ